MKILKSIIPISIVVAKVLAQDYTRYDLQKNDDAPKNSFVHKHTISDIEFKNIFINIDLKYWSLCPAILPEQYKREGITNTVFSFVKQLNLKKDAEEGYLTDKAYEFIQVCKNENWCLAGKDFLRVGLTEAKDQRVNHIHGVRTKKDCPTKAEILKIKELKQQESDAKKAALQESLLKKAPWARNNQNVIAPNQARK